MEGKNTVMHAKKKKKNTEKNKDFALLITRYYIC